MKEGNISRLIMMAASRIGARLFLNPRGGAWVGRVVKKTGDTVVLANARQMVFGVGQNGAADTLGDAKIKITPDMVGKTIHIPSCIEVKKPGEKPRPEQWDFIEFAVMRGWRAGYATNEEEAIAILEGRPEPWQINRNGAT